MHHIESAADDRDRLLLRQAAEWSGAGGVEELTVGSLTRLTALHGVEFATAVLYDRICRSPRYAPFLQQIRAEPGDLAGADLRVIVIPGAFWRELPHTGGDGQALIDDARAAGVPAERIPLHDFAPPAADAPVICSWLARHADRPTVLVTLSKGAAGLRAALAEPNAAEAFRNVRLWISLSGVVEGSAMVGWLLGRFHRRVATRVVCWWRGLDYHVFPTLDRPAEPTQPALPSHITAVHVAGFPLRRHLSAAHSRRGWRRLSPLGPNDGVSLLLGDLPARPGFVLPVWGADHYLRPSSVDIRGVVRRIIGWWRGRS